MSRGAASGVGRVVVLNGAPRSGKSSIASALQSDPDGCWMALGVDAFSQRVTPPSLRPGMGLRPGGERPDIEARLPALVRAFYASVASHAREGLDVVVDVGHHDAYTRPLGLLRLAARELAGLPAWLVGVFCPLDVVVARRERSAGGRYATRDASGAVDPAVLRWQQEVHRHGVYDLTVDTSSSSPDACARTILEQVTSGLTPHAFAELAGG